MPLPKEVMGTLLADIDKAEKSLAELKDIVSDMRLSGMDTAIYDAKVTALSGKLRSLRMFYAARKEKS